MKKEELLCYIWLSLRCGAGSEEASHLLDAFDGAGNVYAAKRDELAAVCDNDATVDSLCSLSGNFLHKGACRVQIP